MSAPPRSTGLRVFSATMLIAGVAIGIALGAEAPDGIPGFYSQPFEEAGEWCQAGLVATLGYASYMLAAGWLVVAVALFRGRSWWAVAGRVLGWCVLTGTAALILDRVGPERLDGPVAGPGGTVGAIVAHTLDARFNPPGPLLITIAAVGLGLLFAAEAVVMLPFRVIRGTGRAMLWIVRPRPSVPIVARPLPPTQPAPEVEVESEEEPETVVVAVAPTPLPNDEPRPAAHRLPPLTLLEEPGVAEGEDEKRLRDVGNLLEKVFLDFGLKVKVVGIHTGPVVTQYEIALETGLRVSRVTSLSDDLALNLKVASVRIVAPLPGRNTVGIELPNEHRAAVRLKELLQAAGPKVAKSKLPLLLGKDSEGRPLVYDLADMPHLLIAGRTGTGKSVCLNSIILSLLITRTPDDCRLLMIDPKQVELAEYGQLPHLMHPVVTDNTKAEAILSWAVDKMEERYELMRKSRVRNIAGYNELGHAEIVRRVKPPEPADAELIPDRLPYIVIIVDEVGDLMMAMKKEVEGHIIRLAQKSRAAGIHLILTTQRPTVDVITGLIKSNLPARICFQVADRSNSRVVLDEMGAEKLLGRGDMLFLQPNTSSIVRAQGAYASDDEIQRVVSHLEVETPEFDRELLNLETEAVGAGPTPVGGGGKKRDPLYEQAVEIVLREGRGSVSLLQRALGIGYGRSARLIDFMAEDGIVGTYNGAQARDILISLDQWSARRRPEAVGAEAGEG